MHTEITQLIERLQAFALGEPDPSTGRRVRYSRRELAADMKRLDELLPDAVDDGSHESRTRGTIKTTAAAVANPDTSGSSAFLRAETVLWGAFSRHPRMFDTVRGVSGPVRARAREGPTL